MVPTSAPGATAKRPDQTIIVDFQPAYQYLYAKIQEFDSDPLCTTAILQILVKEVMDYANQWCDGRAMEDAVEQIWQITRSQDIAFEYAKGTQDLISAQISQHLPDFSISRYSGKYVYHFIGGLYGRIRIDFYSQGAPDGGRQPPG